MQEATSNYLAEKGKADTAAKQIEVNKDTIDKAGQRISELLEEQKKLKTLEEVKKERTALMDRLKSKSDELEEFKKQNSAESKSEEIKQLKKKLQEITMRLQVAEAKARIPSIGSEDSNQGELTSFQEMEPFMNSRMLEVWNLFRQWWTATRGPEDFVPYLTIQQRHEIRKGIVGDRNRAITVVKAALETAVKEKEELDIYKGLPPQLEARFWNTAIKLVEEGKILQRISILNKKGDLVTNNQNHYAGAQFFIMRLTYLKDDLKVYFRGRLKDNVDHRLQKDSAKAEVKTRLNNWYFEVTHDETSRLGRDNHHLRELCEATLVYSFMVGERLVEALDTTRGSMELIEKWCKLFDSNWVVALSLITLWTGNHVFTKLFQDLVKSWGPCQASLQHQGTMADQLSIIRSVTLETPLSVDGTWEVGLAKSKEFIENRLAANSGNKLAKCLVYLINNSHRLSGTALAQ